MTTLANGLITPAPTEKAYSATASPPRVVIAGRTGRILCVADIRGDYHELNRLIREHEATAVIHTGDFGFLTADSLERMGDKILRHLIQYSPLLAQFTRDALLGIDPSKGRAALIEAINQSAIHFPLSQFPHLLSGAVSFAVPVFTVWGLIEDVHVLEGFRTGEHSVPNLNILDEASSRLLDVGGMKLRLFGLGGACVSHKLFDIGEGSASIAGGQGTMWATALQVGELVDTADRVYDASETRLLVCSAPVSRTSLLAHLPTALKLDLTISGGLHFRYPVSFNDFAVHTDYESYRQKLINSCDTFQNSHETVKHKIEASLNETQRGYLKKAIDMSKVIPPTVPDVDDVAWTHTWHWVLTDAASGHMVLTVNDSRVSLETKSRGLDFSHRTKKEAAPPSGINTRSASVMPPPRRPSLVENAVIKPEAPRSNPPQNIPAPSSSVPVKPAALTPAAIANNISKPASQRPVVAPAKPVPTGPAAFATNAPQSAAATSTAPVPSRPMAPPHAARQPRGPGAASQAFAGNAPKADAKPAAPVPAKDRNEPVKPTAPAANGKSTPAPSAAKPTTEKPAVKPAEQKTALTQATPAATEKPLGKPTEASKAEKSAEKAAEKSDAPKPVETIEKAADAQNAANGMEGRPVAEKKWSLYLNKLPVPVTEDEIKALFPASKEKMKNVKILTDRMTGRQKNYGYVDFDNEADQQEALVNHTTIIRDTTITVVLSNPPPKGADFRGRGRGGPGFRGRGMGRFSGAGGPRGGSREGGANGAGAASGTGGDKSAGEKKEAAGGGGGAAAGEKKETAATKKD